MLFAETCLSNLQIELGREHGKQKEKAFLGDIRDLPVMLQGSFSLPDHSCFEHDRPGPWHEGSLLLSHSEAQTAVGRFSGHLPETIMPFQDQSVRSKRGPYIARFPQHLRARRRGLLSESDKPPQNFPGHHPIFPSRLKLRQYDGKFSQHLCRRRRTALDAP